MRPTARGIVHRDIKPQNVLLDEAGDAKVADFGIALAASRTSISGTNLLFGTPSYMSPEQAMGERVGPESDLYSLGVVLYEMLTATVPFAAEGPLATAMKHLTELPLSLRKRNPSVPEAMDALVMRLLSKDPEDRYPSAAQLIDDLRRAREGLPLAFAGAAGYPETLGEPRRRAPLSVLADSPRSKPRRRRSVGIRLVALAALLVLLGGLGWDLSRDLEGLKTVGAVKSSEGVREGGTLVAPKGLVGAREDGSGKGTGQEECPPPHLRPHPHPRIRAPRVCVCLGIRGAGTAGVGARRIGLENPRVEPGGGTLRLLTGTGRFLRLRRPSRGNAESQCW